MEISSHIKPLSVKIPHFHTHSKSDAPPFSGNSPLPCFTRISIDFVLIISYADEPFCRKLSTTLPHTFFFFLSSSSSLPFASSSHFLRPLGLPLPLFLWAGILVKEEFMLNGVLVFNGCLKETFF